MSVIAEYQNNFHGLIGSPQYFKDELPSNTFQG